jgi:uncharacterized DUF497 family protein
MTVEKSGPVIYDFDWDPAKARYNQRKHKVSFNLATTVLRDPLAITIYDTEHSEDEDRWITLGQAANGQLMVVVHTWTLIESAEVKVRIGSARRADATEARDYQNALR